MRIVVHGQDAFGKAVLERLLARGENVVAVCCAPPKDGKPDDPLADLARAHGIPLHQPRSWKTREALELMKSFQADICMMAYVLLFVPQPVLDAPILGTFQYHPSLLPDHRGPSSISWPIAMGKTETGLTIFWPDEGLDEGPILMQRTVEIGPDETLGDVYFNKLFPLGVAAMIESLELVKAGTAPRIPQDLTKGSYESWFKREQAQIDWSKPVAEIYNLIRACNPAPGAWTAIRGAELQIFDAALLAGPDERGNNAVKPGTITAVGRDGVTIAAVGGAILAKRVKPAGSKKIAGMEYATAAGLKVGDVFAADRSASSAVPHTAKSSAGGKTIGSDLEIARQAHMKPIADIAGAIGIPADALVSYGPYKAKMTFDFIEGLRSRPDGRLILVTAINPTPAGEGKTTTTVGLGDGLNRIGRRAISCLREPSLGPCFGVKGGAAGGGYAQVVPMEEINLHFTGDFHAITAANNLLAALVDNHVYWGNALGLDTRRIVWRRVMDMNDRALRSVVSSLGGVANGYPREDGFDITVASEVMAIFCLATDLGDLNRRIGSIVVGYTHDKKPVHARDLKADGAMTVLLKDALMPNLVQTLENNPVIVHGGPFANIAHGCNSVLATKTALKLADYVVTEAGFGADLGAEKFFDIKCRKAGLAPAAAVIVATVRALKMHGGIAKDDLGRENVAAVERGAENLTRHIANVRKFGVPPIVAINRFVTDTEAEIAAVVSLVERVGCRAFLCEHWAKGGAGIEELARHVAEVADSGRAAFKPLYPDEMSLWDKITTIATEIYGAAAVSAETTVRSQIDDLQRSYGHLPICIAKTQYSFSTDPTKRGVPTGHIVPVREVHLSAGAEFIVVVCGEILRMPGLPRVPAAEAIRLNQRGQIEGLF